MSGHKSPSQPDSSASALVAYRPEECTPLLGRTPNNITISRGTWLQILYGLVSISVLLFGIGNLWFHFTQCPMDVATRDAIRREWDMEVARRVTFMEEWRLEQQEHAAIEEDWKRQEDMHDKEVERRIKQESDRQLKVREGWARETEEHRREREQADRREHERQEQERQKWRREIEDYDRIVEEVRRRDGLNLFWGQVEARTCITYATREYTAKLVNLPTSWEHPTEACKAVPLEVHGISYPPKSCEDKGRGVVLGRWEVNQHEPDCATYWSQYKDKGCTSPGSGLRRIEHYLENIPQGCSWKEFCATTPARFNGLEFSGPHECYQYDSATYGLWEIDDDKCA